MRSICYVGREFHVPVDRPGMHDRDRVVYPVEALLRHAEETMIFAKRGEQAAGLPFHLNSENIQGVNIRKHVVDAVIYFYSEPLDLFGDECRRSAHRDLRPHCPQSVNIRPRHPAVGNIADNAHTQTVKRTESFFQRIHVQQCLRRMLMTAIPGIEHSRLNNTSQKVRSAHRVVPYHDHINFHRFYVSGSIFQRLPFTDTRP